ncbi:hypothetical protein ES708_00288 [subsurface metagenome]
MNPDAIGFAAPRAEEMTKVVAGVAGAGITGVVEGATVMFAKGMGALEPIFSWGVLLGAPAVGVAGALFTRGLIGDVMHGVAAGGTAILGYSLPAMIAPEIFARKAPLTAEQRAALAAGGGNAVKMLGEGPARAAAAAARAAAAVRVAVGAGYE